MRRPVLFLVLASALYGVTFPVFRHFDLRAPGGSSDAQSYLSMSHGDLDVSLVRRYRPLVPVLAATVRVPLGRLVSDPVLLDRLAFYVVNYGFALATALLLVATLGLLGFDGKLALLGGMLFVTSRVTVTSVGTPMVDSLYFLAVGSIVHLTVAGRSTALALAMPFLVLAKETVLPFLLVPLARKETRTWGVGASLIASFATLFSLRHLVDAFAPPRQELSLVEVIERLARGNVLPSLARILGPEGVHDLLHPFGALALLAPLGWLAARRGLARSLPGYLLLPVPIAFAFALVSNNLGRMFFAAYVPVIAWSLVLVESVMDAASPGTRETARSRRPRDG